MGGWVSGVKEARSAQLMSHMGRVVEVWGRGAFPFEICLFCQCSVWKGAKQASWLGGRARIFCGRLLQGHLPTHHHNRQQSLARQRGTHNRRKAKERKTHHTQNKPARVRTWVHLPAPPRFLFPSRGVSRGAKQNVALLAPPHSAPPRRTIEAQATTPAPHPHNTPPTPPQHTHTTPKHTAPSSSLPPLQPPLPLRPAPSTHHHKSTPNKT